MIEFKDSINYTEFCTSCIHYEPNERFEPMGYCACKSALTGTPTFTHRDGVCWRHMKTNYRSLTKKLDTLCRVLLHTTERTCFTCGKNAHICEVSHLLSKGAYPSIRWDLQNIHLQCRECHSKHHNGDPIYAAKWVDTYGTEAMNALKRRGNERMSKFQKEELVITLTELVKKAQDELMGVA